MAARQGWREGSWEAYIEHLQYHYQANGLEDDARKKSILMSVCGSETFTILMNLAMPRTTMDLTHSEIMAALKEHCEPTPSFIVSRFNFYMRRQTSTQSLSALMAHLKHVAQHCQFGATFVDMLRDLLVVGVEQDQICRHLFAERTLTFSIAEDIAIAQTKMLQILLAPSLTSLELTCHLSIVWNNIQPEHPMPKRLEGGWCW
uniref:Uncharacterized protein n=1 Tax=Eptatretus burgeri TaxID=7764 RepID=A0A8C4N770_EPTBU